MLELTWNLVLLGGRECWRSFLFISRSCASHAKKSLPTEEYALASYIANKLELVKRVNSYQKINWGSCKDTKSAF